MTTHTPRGEPRAYAARATLEAWHGGAWHRMGVVAVSDPAAGVASPSSFEYDLDYLDALPEALGTKDRRAASCRYPIGYETFEEDRWAAFLLDIVPSGAARRAWVERLDVFDGDASDWLVLIHGASHPPGNLRVAGAVDTGTGQAAHPGFPRSDILERAEGFIEYAHACGAPVSGSSGAGGDSPKFLLREDHQGMWHADGALPDARTRACWLVKFPRTRDRTDETILEAEAAYHRVASRCGVRTFGEVVWEDHCLFVPRFDRVVRRGKVDRLGMESLCSLAGVAEFGAAVRKERLTEAVARSVDAPEVELLELVRRDVLDVAMGNTDNHARNTSVLKDAKGRIALSPLYDFAPMILDRRGVARACRWADGGEYPRWSAVCDVLADLGVDGARAREHVRAMADVVAELPQTMRDCGVPRRVIARCKDRIERVERGLRAVPS